MDQIQADSGDYVKKHNSIVLCYDPTTTSVAIARDDGSNAFVDERCVWNSKRDIHVYGSRFRLILLDGATSNALNRIDFVDVNGQLPRYSTQLLLSALQKAVRRRDAQSAYVSARTLLNTRRRRDCSGLRALSRRLPIILTEDAFHHPSLLCCLWLMMAIGDASFVDLLIGDNRKIGEHFEQLLIGICVQACAATLVDSRPSGTPMASSRSHRLGSGTPTASSRSHRLGSGTPTASSRSSSVGSGKASPRRLGSGAPHSAFCCTMHASSIDDAFTEHQWTLDAGQQSQCFKENLLSTILQRLLQPKSGNSEIIARAALCCALRHSFGGMSGDRTLLHCSAHRWLKRSDEAPDVWATVISGQQQSSSSSSSLKKHSSSPFLYTLAIEAVDFHVYRGSYAVLVRCEAKARGEKFEWSDETLQKMVWTHRSSIYADEKRFCCPLCIERVRAPLQCNDLKRGERAATANEFAKYAHLLANVSRSIAKDPYCYQTSMDKFQEAKRCEERRQRESKRKFGSAACDTRHQPRIAQFFKPK